MFLNAYYFRAHMYTCVPRHVREDMEWMAGAGTRAVTVGVLEQDLTAGVENLRLIADEARRVGLELWAVPSRWGSLVAGCPKVPSIFACRHLEAAIRDRQGNIPDYFLGPRASVHHPATFEFFVASLRRLLTIAPFAGLVWDEPKIIGVPDYSEAARRALAGRDLDDPLTHTRALADFFDRVGAAARALSPGLKLALFTFATRRDAHAEALAAIPHLDDFGCDGRPFGRADHGTGDSADEPADKLLADDGPWFVATARARGKRPLFLIENHALKARDIPAMDRRLPEILAMGAEHVIYYYYPRSLEDPDATMAVLRRHFLARSTP